MSYKNEIKSLLEMRDKHSFSMFSFSKSEIEESDLETATTTVTAKVKTKQYGISIDENNYNVKYEDILLSSNYSAMEDELVDMTDVMEKKIRITIEPFYTMKKEGFQHQKEPLVEIYTNDIKNKKSNIPDSLLGFIATLDKIEKNNPFKPDYYQMDDEQKGLFHAELDQAQNELEHEHEMQAENDFVHQMQEQNGTKNELTSSKCDAEIKEIKKRNIDFKTDYIPSIIFREPNLKYTEKECKTKDDKDRWEYEKESILKFQEADYVPSQMIHDAINKDLNMDHMIELNNLANKSGKQKLFLSKLDKHNSHALNEIVYGLGVSDLMAKSFSKDLGNKVKQNVDRKPKP